MNDDLSIFFSGKALYGDDFDINQINEWFAGEQGGYANLGAKNWVDYSYGYHRLNYQHGYKYIVNKSFNNTLGFGNAYGDELKQIVNNITGNITILDPSDVFSDVIILSQIRMEICHLRMMNLI